MECLEALSFVPCMMECLEALSFVPSAIECLGDAAVTECFSQRCSFDQAAFGIISVISKLQTSQGWGRVQQGI